MIRPAPMFDDLHPLSSHVPLAPCVEDPFFEEVRAALGDPALVDERVVGLPPSDGAVVESDAVVVDDAPPTAALTLVRPSRAVRPPARSRRSPAVAS